jgi:hypothetical protein
MKTFKEFVENWKPVDPMAGIFGGTPESRKKAKQDKYEHQKEQNRKAIELMKKRGMR